MEIIYESLEHFPNFVRTPFLVFCTIIIGYFIAKVFAVLVSTIIPDNNRNNRHQGSGFSTRIAKFCFWFIWGIFCFVGYSFFLNHYEIINWQQTSSSYLWKVIFLCVLCAEILFLSDYYSKQILNKFRKSYELRPMSYNIIFAFVILFAIILIGPKLMVFKMLIGFGVALSKVAKEVVSSALDLMNNGNKTLSKFTFYFLLTGFVIIAAQIWISPTYS